MDFGLLMFPTHYAISPADLAREAEARGFESLLFPEHTHIPVSRLTPWPGGKELPEEYKHTHDPFVALAMAAAVTSRIKIGTGICLVIQRDPLTLAKEVATLDHLSGGRFLFGVGGGWNVEEIENHATPFKARWTILRERIEAMRAIWTQDEAEYHGQHVSFDAVWSWPKPVQKPHPPILLGTGSAKGRQRVVDYCDGWMPIAGRDPIEPGVQDLRRRAEAAGRDPASIPISIFGAPADEQKLDALRRIGISRAVFGVPPAGRDTVLPILDHYAAIAKRLASA